MDARKKAIEDWDGKSYAQACDEEGVQPEIKELYDQGLAEILISEMQKSPRAKGIPPNFGIRRKDLKTLGYKTLEHIFYGIHNLDIPNEMLAVMNPDEILVKYYAVGKLKRNNRHQREENPHDFVALTKKMDGIGYAALGFMTHDTKKRFSDKKGEQRARLDALDEHVKQAFIDSFHEKYIPSTRESMYHLHAFYDKNIDGKSRGVYITDIYRFFESKWKHSRKNFLTLSEQQ